MRVIVEIHWAFSFGLVAYQSTHVRYSGEEAQ